MWQALLKPNVMAKRFCNFFTLLIFGVKKYPDPPKEPLVPNTKFHTVEPSDRLPMNQLWTDYLRQLK
jgi:hypothetical protein